MNITFYAAGDSKIKILTLRQMKEGGIRLTAANQPLANKNPLITVITVTYNADKFLEECINSVARQEYQNIEHLIFDGGSSDGTLDILRNFNDKVAYWRSEPDKGIYNAMNKAITFAKGKWILFLGADDVLLPGFSTMAYLLKDENCIYYGDSKFQDGIHGGPFSPYRLVKFNICHQNIFYPNSVFKYYMYNENYEVSADYHLNILCYTDQRFRFEYHPILVAVYSEGGFSSMTVDIFFNRDKDKIIKDRFSTLIYWRYKLRKFRHYLKGRK